MKGSSKRPFAGWWRPRARLLSLPCRQPSRSRAALDLVGDLLRRTLATESERETPLQVEIEYARTYLKVMALRFSDRLRVTREVPAELLECLMPPLILQPLIENAVRWRQLWRGVCGALLQWAWLMFHMANAARRRAHAVMLALSPSYATRPELAGRQEVGTDHAPD